LTTLIRAPFTADLTDPEGLKGFWEWFEATPPALRAQVTGPVMARLRAFLLRDFVRATITPIQHRHDPGPRPRRHPHRPPPQRPTRGGDLTPARLDDLRLGVAGRHRPRPPTRTPPPRRKRRDRRSPRLPTLPRPDPPTPRATAREVQLAISANARNKIYFNCSPEDAHVLARHTAPELDEHDLTHLDAYTAAARLVIDNRETATLTLATRPAASL
jgi:hypothetical protein